MAESILVFICWSRFGLIVVPFVPHSALKVKLRDLVFDFGPHSVLFRSVMATKSLIKCQVPDSLRKKIKDVAIKRLMSEADIVREALLAFLLKVEKAGENEAKEASK